MDVGARTGPRPLNENTQGRVEPVMSAFIRCWEFFFELSKHHSDIDNSENNLSAFVASSKEGR